MGSRGDSSDNALAETVIGLFQTEVIRRRGPWRSLEDVEFESIGYVPPAEYEAAYYQQTEAVAVT